MGVENAKEYTQVCDLTETNQEIDSFLLNIVAD